jgi:hypothetical protein
MFRSPTGFIPPSDACRVWGRIHTGTKRIPSTVETDPGEMAGGGETFFTTRKLDSPVPLGPAIGPGGQPFAASTQPLQSSGSTRGLL